MLAVMSFLENVLARIVACPLGASIFTTTHLCGLLVLGAMRQALAPGWRVVTFSHFQPTTGRH